MYEFVLENFEKKLLKFEHLGIYFSFFLYKDKLFIYKFIFIFYDKSNVKIKKKKEKIIFKMFFP